MYQFRCPNCGKRFTKLLMLFHVHWQSGAEWKCHSCSAILSFDFKSAVLYWVVWGLIAAAVVNSGKYYGLSEGFLLVLSFACIVPTEIVSRRIMRVRCNQGETRGGD